MAATLIRPAMLRKGQPMATSERRDDGAAPPPLFPLARWQAALPDLASRFQSARPTPHVHLEDVLDVADARALAAAFPMPDQQSWIQYQHFNENKMGMTKRGLFPPLLGRLVDELNGPAFVSWLEELTGMRGLVADPDLEGGGLHQSGRGASSTSTPISPPIRITRPGDVVST